MYKTTSRQTTIRNITKSNLVNIYNNDYQNTLSLFLSLAEPTNSGEQ